jgi:hypothetical protein
MLTERPKKGYHDNLTVALDCSIIYLDLDLLLLPYFSS